MYEHIIIQTKEIRKTNPKEQLSDLFHAYEQYKADIVTAEHLPISAEVMNEVITEIERKMRKLKAEMHDVIDAM